MHVGGWFWFSCYTASYTYDLKNYCFAGTVFCRIFLKSLTYLVGE